MNTKTHFHEHFDAYRAFLTYTSCGEKTYKSFKISKIQKAVSEIQLADDLLTISGILFQIIGQIIFKVFFSN